MPDEKEYPANGANSAPDAENDAATPSPEGGEQDVPVADFNAGAVPEEMAGEVPGEMAEAISRLEGEKADLTDRLARALAETENLRRRAQREKEETAKYSVANFARDLLDVADNLSRALESIPDSDDEMVSAITEGVRMTERVLANALERHGVRCIESEGERFDPNLHQAMFEVDNAAVPAGTVMQVMQKGYVIHDRLLRPAMVGVAKGGPKVSAADPENGNGAG